MSVVSSVLVFLLFVQGGQTLVGVLGKTDNEKNMIVNSIGRKWEFTFTTLIVFAAGMFAAFPLWYSVSLGGAYYAWKIFLVCFVLQAVSFEFRRKKGNIFGQKTYDWFLTINGFLGTILLGVVVATFFTGSDFIRNEYNLSQWGSSWYGLDILASFTNLSLGFAVLFLARTLGAMYIITNIESDDIIRRARKQTLINGAIFTVFFLYFLVRILIKDGYAYNPETGAVFMESYKYLNNYLQMPVALILFLVGVPLVLYGIFITWAKESNRGIWFSGFGTFATVMSIFWILGYNNTAFYPSYDLQSSLTIQNASSSHYTLTAMSYISLFVPVVITYIYFAWRAVDKTKISEKHMNKEGEHHVY
ncbi:cytochrome d ubiquinol oxidase subunit II [Alkalitalea saponilacus]|uniref:Cytochrome d ubiquinol oxidase subunit II n=2 Tax=Alkalitalea saponilacus TaxID=889453 RepID=A0A1T5AIG3_9BACT|nr:cytochrome d ubiquinol oxidase subunit II [Alkalitalea saponilacus]